MVPAEQVTVLVVDDHRDTARALKVLLTREGFSVRTARGYHDAVAAARAERIDVLICDLQLEDCDGSEVLAELMSIRPVAAIAMTGVTLLDERARCERAGFKAFMVKPVHFHELIEQVKLLASSRPPEDRPPDSYNAMSM